MPRGASLRRRRAIAAAAAAVVIGAGLGTTMAILGSGGLEAWLAAREPRPLPVVPPYEARGTTVQVDGRGVYLDCRGSGSPTVILEAGFGSGASAWGATLDGIAAFTRVCAWDRPGLGRSEARGRHSAAETAAVLRDALAVAGERGPYIVVAHSLGGVYARIFGEGPGADGQVVSYLMLDTYDPDLGMVDDPALPLGVREEIGRNLATTAAMLEAGEDLDWARTLEELAVAGPVDLPAIGVSGGDPASRFVNPDPATTQALVAAFRRAIARTFPNTRQEIAADSGHMVPYDRPDLVIARTLELVEMARGGTGVP